ncbi:MAG: transglycosylase SLT domain-containing protein [Acidobacteriota bacterium]
MRPTIIAAGLMVAAVSAMPSAERTPHPTTQRGEAQAPDLRSTVHPAVPAIRDEFWLVPPIGWRLPARPDAILAVRDLARASTLLTSDKPSQALPLIKTVVLATTPLAGYAIYLKGVADLRLERFQQARDTLSRVRVAQPPGFLVEAAGLREGEAAEALRDYTGAIAIYEDVLARTPATPSDVLLRLAHAAQLAGQPTRAVATYERILYEWPTSDEAAAAADELANSSREPLEAGSSRVPKELARAERLFAARWYDPARAAFATVRPYVAGDESELVALRLAECDHYLRRDDRAREALRPYLGSASRRAEALFFYLSATRTAGDAEAYIGLVRRLVDQYPDSTWAEEALNNLATHFMVQNEDEQADQVFREIASRFPAGKYTPRAHWKVGWRTYRLGGASEAIDVFERAAAAFPRSDFRPSWLYWAGKAREKFGDRSGAEVRLRLLVEDYRNSYYGRLAAQWLRSHGLAVPGGPEAAARFVAPGGLAADSPGVPTAGLIRWLIAAEMNDEALDEVQYAERAYGSSPVLLATRAWLVNRKGDLRPAITLMRQAYPQFLAAGGEILPADILRIMFPRDYWPLITKYSALNGLDPYMVTALMAQESTFDARVVSGANAIGLMQVVPSTGRLYARKLGLRGYSTKKLTVPDTNVRIGTAYFADLVRQFGDEYFALAGYNAGDSRAVRWKAERPGLDRDEFIDDIPFPETQNYLRRVIGTAEDYRALYGPSDARSPRPATTGSPAIRRQPG